MGLGNGCIGFSRMGDNKNLYGKDISLYSNLILFILMEAKKQFNPMVHGNQQQEALPIQRFIMGKSLMPVSKKQDGECQVMMTQTGVGQSK
jgi:hypothetical protein